MTKEEEQYQAEFWQDYEKRYGEKVFSYVLGKYLSGWPDYEYPLWGLFIATESGLRFHHFPQEGWLQAQIRVSSGAAPLGEKTIFIPRERILSADLRLEKNRWKKIFFCCPPILAIQYRREDPENPEQAGLLLAEAYQTGKVFISALVGSIRQLIDSIEQGPAG
jgi:hypothetical protein